MIRDATDIVRTRPQAPVKPPAADATYPSPMPVPPPDAPLLNPSMRIEGSLNLVVLEFRDTKGEVVRSIPSEREMDAYRSHGAAEEGQAENGAAPDHQISLRG